MNVRTKNLICACRRLEETTSPAQKWRPQFHLSPPTGWMNDPNGLCQFRGSHHIFFQYSPFDVQTGLNYWGHFETADFVHYQYHQPALCSDEQFDCHGVYSGSALENDGVLYLFYTGNVKKTGDGYDYVNNGREHNTIRACSRDGVNFGEKTLLLSNSDYPGNVTCHVRDPKVWKDAAGGHMVLGARRRDDVGEVLVYRSGDLLHWTLASTITTPEPFGFMWECPDFFRLDGAQVLSFSPQGVEAQDWKYENIYQSGYCLLDGALEGGLAGSVGVTQSDANIAADSASGFVQPYADSPLDGEPVGENVYMGVVKAASEYVYFTTPYLIISDEMSRELCLAAKRGVDVRIVTPGIPDKKLVYRVTRSYYAQLASAGVRIFEYTPGFLHAKQCVSDDVTATVGTINLDYRSLYFHFENGVFLHRCEAVRKVREDFEDIFPVCREVTEQYAKKQSAAMKFGQCVLRLIAPLL